MALTAEKVRELLDYDPETGVFTWRVAKGRKSKGMPAGCIDHYGYVQIGIDGTHYKGHRIAWLIINGSWPSEHIDHLNGIRDDNRIANLRKASRSINMQNQRVPVKGNTSGFLGVCWDNEKRSFLTQIRVKGKNKFLGRFADPSEAHAVYLDAKRRLHAGCTI
ncbi:MAG: HNH endonuclease [Chromatiaceae bacterium]|nr:HNH endonuclease [Chromatiaceae bacterium]